MRRPGLIAALVVLLTLPSFAQRRGFSAPPGRSLSAAPSVRGSVARTAPRVIINGGFGFGHNPRFGVFFNTRPFHYRRYFRTYNPYFYGYPYYPYTVYPYTLYPYYGIGLQSDIIYSDGAPPTYANSAPAYMADHDTGLQNEVYQLRAEVDQLRHEQAERQQYALNTPSDTPRPIPSTRPRPETQAPRTVLVFRDGRREEVRNYAVAGQTLWVFSEERARKVPVADLDLQATRTANEERGVEFAARPPDSNH